MASQTCRRYVSCVSCSISESNSGTSDWSESDSSLFESANISVSLVGQKIHLLGRLIAQSNLYIYVAASPQVKLTVRNADG